MGMDPLTYPTAQDFCNSSFAWGTEPSPSVWDNSPDSTVMFSGDDFDVNAIPPIQLGMSNLKFSGELPSADYVEYGQQLQNTSDQYIDDHQIMGFDDMITGHSF